MNDNDGNGEYVEFKRDDRGDTTSYRYYFKHSAFYHYCDVSDFDDTDETITGMYREDKWHGIATSLEWHTQLINSDEFNIAKRKYKMDNYYEG